MIASKLTFSKETRQKLDNPVLDHKKKRELRIARIKEFIREQPAGTKLRYEDIIYAAGYDSKDPKSYNTGYAFCRSLVKKGIIDAENTTAYLKLFTIPEDAVVTQTSGRQTIDEIRAEDEAKKAEANKVVETTTESSKIEAPVVTFTRLEYQVVDVEEVRRIENLAREFSWSNDSDSLREFIKSLK